MAPMPKLLYMNPFLKWLLSNTRKSPSWLISPPIALHTTTTQLNTTSVHNKLTFQLKNLLYTRLLYTKHTPSQLYYHTPTPSYTPHTHTPDALWVKQFCWWTSSPSLPALLIWATQDTSLTSVVNTRNHLENHLVTWWVYIVHLYRVCEREWVIGNTVIIYQCMIWIYMYTEHT